MEVYTYGSGEFIASIFEAVKILTSGGTIVGLLKVVLIAGLFAGLSSTLLRVFNSSVSMPLSGDSGGDSFAPIVIMIRNCAIGAIAVGFFLNPYITTDVVIEDRYEPAQSRTVTEVPYGMAFIGYATSVIGDRVGEAIEEVLTPVEAVRFRSGGGIGIGPKYLNELFELMPPGAPAEYGAGSSNVPIRGVVEAWFTKCIYSRFGLIEGEGPRAEGLTRFASSDFLLVDPVLTSPPFSDPNTPLDVQFYGYPDANETTCRTASAQIVTRWYDNDLFNKWITRFSARMFGTREDDATIPMRIYDIVDRYFPDSMLGSQDKVVQLATLNAAYSAFVKMYMEYSGGSASDLAKKRQAGGWLEMARTGSRMLIVVRQIAEALIYFFGAFLPVFIAAAGFGVLTKYIKAVFWLQLWIPVFVILNAIADVYTVKAIENLCSYSGGVANLVLNFETVDKLRTETGMIVGYLGLISISVPGIAWGILQGGASLGGMVGSIASSHESGRSGSASVAQRPGAMLDYQAGTMLSSTHKAGLGQATMGAEMRSSDKWGMESFQNMTSTNLEHNMSVGMAKKSGEISRALSMGGGMLASAGSTELARSVMSNIGNRDTYDYMKNSGAIPASMGFEEYTRTASLGTTVNTPDGKLTSHFAPDGSQLFSMLDGGNFSAISDSTGKQVAGERKGFIELRGHNNTTRSIYGTLTQTGDSFTATGVDDDKKSAVTLTGSAKDIDLKNGVVYGYDTISEKDTAGISEKVNAPRGEALKMLSSLAGTDFYNGVKSMGDGPVAMNIERDKAGNIAHATATQGGRSFNYDHAARLTGSSDTDENMVTRRYGTDSWSGYRNVTENSDMRSGVFKDVDPETGKEGMFYGRWHSDPATGKQVAADFTNLQTGRVSTVRTTTDDKGNETKHFGMGTYQSGPNGVGQVSDFRETSTEEIENKGYATQKTKGQAGNTLMQVDRQGQDTSKLHRFTIDHSQQFKTTVGAGLQYTGDLTQMGEGREDAIKAVGLIDKGAELFQGVAGFKRSVGTVFSSKQGAGATPGTTEKTVNASEARPPSETKPPMAKRETEGPVR